MRTLMAALIVVAMANGCMASPTAAPVRLQTKADGARVLVHVGQPRVGLQVLAAAKTRADIDHLYLSLVDVQTGRVVAAGVAPVGGGQFVSVPDGTYHLEVDALDAAGNSLVQGGSQISTNTVTVAGATAVYSDGGDSLRVQVKLLDETP